MPVLVVSGSYQNYQTVGKGGGEYVECDSVYTVLCTLHSLIVTLSKTATPKSGKFKYYVT